MQCGMAEPQESSPAGLNGSRQSLDSPTRDSEALPPELRPGRSSSSNEACKEMEEMLQEEALNEDLPPPKPAASGSPSTPTKPRIPKKKKMKEKKTRRGNSKQLRKGNAVQQPELQSSSLAFQHLNPSQRPRETIPDVEGPQARAPARDLRVVLQSVREKVGAPQAHDPTPDGPPAPLAPGPRREEDHFRVEMWCEPHPILPLSSPRCSLHHWWPQRGGSTGWMP